MGDAVNLVTVLRDAGLPVDSGWIVPPAPGVFSPVGVMAHHTAGTNSRRIVREGDASFGGPRCNILIPKTGVVEVVTHGKAYDSGMGSRAVLDRVRLDLPPLGDARILGYPDDTNGNRWFYDIEVENLGNSTDPYTDAQLDSLVKSCAAICKANAWTANRVIHHREWTRRKIDMSWRGDLRGLTAQEMEGDMAHMSEEAQKFCQAFYEEAKKHEPPVDGVQREPNPRSLFHVLKWFRASVTGWKV